MAEGVEQLSSLKAGVMNYHNPLFLRSLYELLEQNASEEKLMMNESGISSTSAFLMAKGLLRAVVWLLWFDICVR